MRPAHEAGADITRLGALLAACLLMAGCTVKSPAVPRLEFTVSISVADDTTTIGDVAADRSDYLEVEGEAMALNFSVDLGDQGYQEVGDRLTITPVSTSFSTEMGDLAIPGQQIPRVSISMSDLLGRDIPSGTLPLLPAASVDQRVPLPLANVTSLTIESGGLDIAISNGLPVALENVRLALTDKGNEVDALDLGTIGPGESASDSFVLAGKTISGDLALSVSAGTARGTNVTIQGDPSLEIEATLQTLLVSEAVAIIPAQEFSDSQVIGFPDDRIQVTEALIAQGGMTLVVTNEIPVIMEVELTLDDLLDATGNPQSFLIDSLSEGVARTITFDLDGSAFRPANPLEIALSYRAKTFETPREVAIRSDGRITVKAQPEQLVFSRVAGRLDRLALPLEMVERDEDIDFPEGLDNVALAQSSLQVFVTSAVGFSSFIGLEIEGENRQEETGHLSVAADFEAGSPDNPQSILIEPESQELTDFLNLLPTKVSVTPTVLIGDGQSEEVIEPDHWVRVDSVVFRAPASFRIKEDTRIQPEPMRRTFDDEEARRRVTSNVRWAEVRTKITNHVPLGVGVRLFVAPDSASVYSDTSLAIPPMSEPPFEVSPAPFEAGRVTAEVTNNQTVLITKEEILELIQPVYWTGVQIKIAGTGGDVTLSASDYVIVQAGTQIVLELNEDLVD